MNILDIDLAYEKRPVITAILVLGSHIFFLPALLAWLAVTFPEHEFSIATIFIWIWLAWATVTVVGTIKYLKKIAERRK